MLTVKTIQPKGAEPHDAQKHTAVVLRENEREFVVARLYPHDLTEILMPKFAWEEAELEKIDESVFS